MDLRTTHDGRLIVRTSSAVIEQSTAAAPGVEAPKELQRAGDSGCAQTGGSCEPTWLDGCAAFPPCLGEGFWVDVDLLLWWRNGRRFPPLVTTQPDNGVLPGATILFGGGRADEPARAGGRVEFGLWTDEHRCLGLGGSFVGVSEAPIAFAVDSAAVGLLARPFLQVDPTNPNNSTQAAVQIANVNATPAIPGDVAINAGSDLLAGSGFFRLQMCESAYGRTDFLFGYQFGRIDENLAINTTTRDPSAGTTVVSDAFAADNEFHGGHFGLQGEYCYGRWVLGLWAKAGFGNMRQTVSINGWQLTDGQPNALGDSGLLAQQRTNEGRHRQDDFAYAEDVGIELSYHPLPRLRFSVGYSLMYWSSVVRPGDQIDLSVDQTLLNPGGTPNPNAVHPRFVFNPTAFYVHGLTLGAEVRF